MQVQTSKSALCKLQLVRRASVSERDQPGHRTVLSSEERRDLVVTMKKALSDRAGVTKDPLKSAKHFGERRQEAKESV